MMKHILTLESFLKGSRQPLYHFTSSLERILTSDTLNTSKDEMKDIDSVSLTTYGNIENDFLSNRNRITLDTDLLIRDGYKPRRFDVIGHMIKTHKPDKIKNDFNHLNKSAILRSGKFFKTPIPKEVKHKFYQDYEAEELILKHIKNLGKYIISIDIKEGSIDNWLNSDVLLTYLEKYPHIEINSLSTKNHYITVKPVKVPELIVVK